MDNWKDRIQPREIHPDAKILVRTKGLSLLSSPMTSVEEARRTYQEVCWWEGCAWNWRMESLV